MATPYMTSNDLISAVKRKISLPVSQDTFSEDDILAFANEEMMIAQVPSILTYHEEYFVFSEEVELEADKLRYPIPNRAIGMRLRDVFYMDTNENLYEMTRINPDDKAFFQRDAMPSGVLSAFYIEGNDIVLPLAQLTSPTGSLVFSYFLRPNQLVLNERAAVLENFRKTVTVSNSDITAGDTITIDDEVFTAVASSPGDDEFEIGVSSTVTATNLVSAINTNGVVTAAETSPASATITLTYTDRNLEITASDEDALEVQSTIGLIFDAIPTNITAGTYVDFLQTNPGHRTYSINVEVPTGSISGTQISFPEDSVPENFIIDDYIATVHECIIPQIPPDLHNGLAERTCARILASLGDNEGLQSVNSKIQEIERSQGNLLDQRVDGAPIKIVNRHSILRYGKYRPIRRY